MSPKCNKGTCLWDRWDVIPKTDFSAFSSDHDLSKAGWSTFFSIICLYIKGSATNDVILEDEGGGSD